MDLFRSNVTGGLVQEFLKQDTSGAWKKKQHHVIMSPKWPTALSKLDTTERNQTFISITPRTPLGECSERRPVETGVNVKIASIIHQSGRNIETTFLQS